MIWTLFSIFLAVTASIMSGFIAHILGASDFLEGLIFGVTLVTVLSFTEEER